MTVSVLQSLSPILQFFADNGTPLAGGQLLCQVGGVNYPAYSDPAGTIPLPNPVILNARGEICGSTGITSQFWLQQGVVYSLTLSDSVGNQIWYAGNVVSAPSASTGSVLTYGSQSFTAIQGQTSFSLASTPVSQVSTFASLNGAVLTPGVDFTVSGNVLNFPAGANANDLLYTWYSTAVGNVFNQTFSGNVADFRNILYQRNAAYSGGTNATVNACLEVVTNVTSPTAGSDEWAGLFVMNNSATAGGEGGAENVALYAQGNKVVGNACPTWGATIEVREEIATNNPATGTIGLEVDVSTNGTDSEFSRIGIDVVCRQFTPSGVTTTTGWGVRVQNQGDTAGTQSIIENGFAVWEAYCVNAFDCATSTVVSGALRMAQGQPILFDISGSGGATLNKIAANSATVGIDHDYNGVGMNRLLSTGGLGVNTSGTIVQVVGPQQNTGVTSATLVANSGTALNSASTFDGYTLPQVVKALRLHGLLQ